MIRRYSKLVGLSFVLPVCSVVALPAAAEEAIEEIVVTARGVEERVRDIPVAVSVVDETRMKNLGLSSIQDIASVMPQLNVLRASSGSGTTVSIRGIGSNFTSIGIEQSVSTVIDGVYYPQGRVINEGLFDVRQVAVLKGPQALFFGKNATAGVVAIESNDPGDEFEFIGKAGYETEQERQSLEAVLSGPITETLGARLAIRSTQSDDGFISNSAPATTYTTVDAVTRLPTVHPNGAPSRDYWSGEETFYARLTLDWQPTDQLGFKLKASKSELELNSPTGANELYRCPALGVPQRVVAGAPVPNPLGECRADRNKDENPIPFTIARTNPVMNRFGGQLGETYDAWSVTLTGEYALESVNIVGVANYHDQETDWVGDFDASGATSTMAGENNTFDNLSFEVRASTTLDSPFNFVGGLYYQKTDRTFDQDVLFAAAQNNAAVDPTDVFTAYEKHSGTDGKTFSAYGEMIWDFAERWQVTAGVRYIDEEKDSFYEQPYVNPNLRGLFRQAGVADVQKFDELVPEITVRYEITDNITLYAGYKEGFKSGGFSNSGILGSISGSLEDFTFEPETVDGFEAGLKGAFLDGTLNIELEGYTYDFEDLQIDFFNSPQFANVTENAGSSKTDGAELQLTWLPAGIDGLTVRGGVIFNVSKYTDFIAPCYAGQRPSQGCTIIVAGQVPKQDLSGEYRALAPKWAYWAGLDYDFSVGAGLMFGFSANYQHKDRHQLSEFGHFATWQGGYEVMDFSVRLGAETGLWQVAFITRNIGDEYALLSTRDTPSTGGGTGTANGFLADQNGIPIPGETYELELTVRL